jgi:hypothetical protein
MSSGGGGAGEAEMASGTDENGQAGETGNKGMANTSIGDDVEDVAHPQVHVHSLQQVLKLE